jgi:hypothetical protein
MRIVHQPSREIGKDKPVGKKEWAKFLIASTLIVCAGAGVAILNGKRHSACEGHEIMAGRFGTLIIEKGENRK